MYANWERWASSPMLGILLWEQNTATIWTEIIRPSELKALPLSQRYPSPLPSANMTRRLP